MKTKQEISHGRAVNMFEESGRYFQTLPPASKRKAEKLDKHFSDVERVFLWVKGENQ